jgi:hypothetical protein
MNRYLITLAAASALVGAIPASAQEKPVQGCKSAEARQFDFWIGEWRVTENGKPAGHNRIEPLLDGCALLENWIGAQGGAGKSLNFFDRDDGLWHQTWIDRSGGALFLSGRFSNGAMRLTGERPASDKQPAMRHRITWTTQADGSVRQLWESSPPGKEEWATQFDGRYVREKAAPPSN